MLSILKHIAYALLLPLTLIKDIFLSKRSVIRKIGYLLLSVIVFGTIWWNGVSDLVRLFQITSYDAGLADKLTKVPTRGTSMMPTIPDGSEVELKSPHKYGLERGDIVTFSNTETRGQGYIKRIVGLPGEQISIKNGNVFINGKALQEDYTLNGLPTFGNTAIIDCESYTIPDGSYAVFGDNRTVSSDSRVLGFIKKEEIDGVMKTGTGEKFASEEKQLQISKVDVSPEEFLKKLNELREKNNASNLVTHATLNNLAKQRSTQISENFDNWKSKSIPVDQMLEKEGYRFNQVHEYVTFGYLDSQAILDQLFDSEVEKDHFLSNQYTEVGIGLVEKTNKECTFPLISVILSWPAVPTYDKAVLDNWEKEISTLNSNLGIYQSWVGAPEIDQAKLKQLISMTAEMQQIATRILAKEKNREWLTAKDYADIKHHDDLVQQATALDKEVFAAQNVQGVSISPDARRY
jgi:signal peptidase I